jgi:hypothetical protein
MTDLPLPAGKGGAKSGAIRQRFAAEKRRGGKNAKEANKCFNHNVLLASWGQRKRFFAYVLPAFCLFMSPFWARKEGCEECL